MIAPYLASSLPNLFKPENKRQFRLIKDLNSVRMNEFSIHGSMPVTLCSNMLTFRDSNKTFKLDGDLLKTMTIYKFNVDYSNLKERKTIREFTEEMIFDNKNIGCPSTRDKSPTKMPNSPAIMASGVSTLFLPSDTNELQRTMQ